MRGVSAFIGASPTPTAAYMFSLGHNNRVSDCAASCAGLGIDDGIVITGDNNALDLVRLFGGFDVGIAIGASADRTHLGVINYATYPSVRMVEDLGTLTTDLQVIELVFSHGGTLSTMTGASRYPINITGEVMDARAMVGTAPSGGSVVVDINRNGTSMFGTKPTITTGTNDSGLVKPDTNFLLTAGQYLTVDIDTVTAPAADLTVVVRVRRG